MTKTVVVSLGGNALSSSGKVRYKKLVKSIEQVAALLVLFVKKKYNLVVVFGSGPQVGALLLQNELAKKKVKPMPLDVLDAEVQGELGYLLEQALQNALQKHRVKRRVVSLLTQVIVDKHDPMFAHPSKPVGSFLTKKKAMQLKRKGIPVMQDAGRGWRKVVPSPLPLAIDDVKVIKRLVKQNVVIAAGGGGIPVIKQRGKLKGVEAVIDKDLASALLASSIKASELFIITTVPFVYLDYKKKKQRKIKSMKVRQAKKYLREGHFLPGSMRPKIRAALNFLQKGGKKVTITNTHSVSKALVGKAGTKISH